MTTTELSHRIAWTQAKADIECDVAGKEFCTLLPICFIQSVALLKLVTVITLVCKRDAVLFESDHTHTHSASDYNK